jgi:hypothetical protein
VPKRILSAKNKKKLTGNDQLEAVDKDITNKINKNWTRDNVKLWNTGAVYRLKVVF